MGQFIDFIIYIVLLAVGTAMLVFLLKCAIRPLRGAFSGGGSHLRAPQAPQASQASQVSRVSRSEGRLAKADKLIEKKNYKKAIKTLVKGLALEKEIGAEVTLSDIKNRQQDILSRFLLIAEELGTRIENLSQIEQLLLKHAELSTDLGKARQSYKNLKSRREKLGKVIPDWSKKDFKQQVDSISKDRKANIRELNKEMDLMIKNLKKGSPSKEENVTYH